MMQKKRKYGVILLLLGVSLIISLIFNLINIRNYHNDENNSVMISVDTSFKNTDENKREMITNAMEKTLENMIEDYVESVEKASIKINISDKVSFVSVILDGNGSEIVAENDVDGIVTILVKSVGDLSEENIVIFNNEGEKLK